MILKKIAKKPLDYDIVVRVEFLGTKVRAYLIEGYIDVYFDLLPALKCERGGLRSSDMHWYHVIPTPPRGVRDYG